MRSYMRTFERIALLAAAAGFSGCASSLRASTAHRPRLRHITPDSIELLAGNLTAIDLHGFDFDTSRAMPDNTVRIGPLMLRAVPSEEKGTVIHVAVPARVASSGEAPPTQWLPGRYPVNVTTRLGTSDTVMLTIASRGREP
jgi:hypothetical protein